MERMEAVGVKLELLSYDGAESAGMTLGYHLLLILIQQVHRCDQQYHRSS
jgi:hypothetical protein